MTPQPRLTIVMYHYVRPLSRTRFPRIKALDLDRFRGQLEYLLRHYQIVSGTQVIAAARGPGGSTWDLPPNAALLTFDDGYADHFDYVFPLLDEARLPACFFPPSATILDRTLLDVNRIHYILAAVDDCRSVVDEIFDRLDRHRSQYALKRNEELYAEYAAASRFDPAEVIFVKRILQKGLPEDLRRQIAGELFARFVTADERAFSEELYMSLPQLRLLRRQGMYVGSHGHAHHWLGRLSPEAQERDVRLSLNMLEEVGTDTSSWIMCYPYGDSDESLRRLLPKMGCTVGLTTEVGIASSQSQALLLPRLDTNDLPCDPKAEPSPWTVQLRT